MSLPNVAIIGRPNVGKSSLLNALVGEMISIVEPTAGVTRDRVSTLIERENRYFELIDTGGYGIVDEADLTGHIENQINQAIRSADRIIFMVDIRDGVTPLDQTIARMLRQRGMDVLGVANKADSAKMFPAAADFVRLGFGDFLCISVTNNLNKQVLLDGILKKIAHLESEKPQKPMMKLTIVGKRNAGKSTFVNALAGSERVIVSEIPGTTRDAVDVVFERDGKTIMVIDTAGVRKKKRIVSDNIEFYSYVRATKSMHRADVVLFMLEAPVPISQVDKKLATFIIEEYKTAILVVNKWDLAKDSDATTDDFADYIGKLLPGLSYVPIAFTTAKDTKNVQSVLDLATELFKQATTQISTGKLNKAIEIIKEERVGSHRSAKASFPKIYYATQIAVNPITILMFVNDAKLFDEGYLRFIRNRLRTLLPIAEVPIRLLTRPRRHETDRQ